MSINRRKIINGVVVSDKNANFRVIEEKRKVIGHVLYKKQVTKTKRLHAHDPNNISKVGDNVKIQECRPLSATIRWKIIGINNSQGVEVKESDVN